MVNNKWWLLIKCLKALFFSCHLDNVLIFHQAANGDFWRLDQETLRFTIG
jgi:hypothetical protein